MKIGILTYYGVHNHGAVLQANALKSVLQKMINRFEKLIGDVVSTVNIILPTSIRKQLYREFLHKER